MALAVRLAVRGHGRVEPNPMVGCVVLDRHGETAGWGWHRRLGGDHAEVEALRRAGERARGGTVVVTLEPCNHHGRTPPCTEAIVRSGAARVVFAARDPHPAASGGAEALRAAGVETQVRPGRAAELLNAPFLRRVIDGRPWIAAKWAQSIDGAIACRNGESRWISSERLRRAVHRERGRVDAVMTGIGTVMADDPALTARGVTTRRRAIRVVVDPGLAMRPDSALARGASDGPPVLVAANPSVIAGRADRCAALRSRGVRILELPEVGAPLTALVRALASDHGVSRLMVESGGGLLGALWREELVDECWVVVTPRIAGDAMARRPVRGFEPLAVSAMPVRRLVGSWRRGDEMVLLYR